MSFTNDYVAVMTSQDNIWKLDIMGEDPMGFLTQPPRSLPKFNDCIWVVQFAILSSAEPVDLTSMEDRWRPRSMPALTQPRALLLLKTKKYKQKKDGSRQGAVWELPQGRVLGTDVDVGSALRRIVSKKTGLTVKDIMGGFVRLVVLDSDPDKRAQLKMFFAVSVAELAPSGNPGDVRVLPSNEYTGYRWIRQMQDAGTLPVSDLHLPLIDRALTFRPERWQSPLNYLDQATSALPYHDRYDYFVAAVISREGTPGTGRQILLVMRKADNGKDKWELPGGYCDTSYKTVDQALRLQVQQETGLQVDTVLGQLRTQPLVRPGWREIGARSIIILPYEISVEPGAVNVQGGAAFKWVRTKKDISRLRIKPCNLKLICAAMGLSSPSTSVVMSNAEQDA